MKKYRKRFILTTMSLVGLVLLVTFVVQAVILYRQRSSELRDTMMMVLRPLDESNEKLRPIDDMERPAKPDKKPDGREQEQALPEPRKNDFHSKGSTDILTVYYNKKTEDLSVLSEQNTVYPDDLEEVVNAVIKQSPGYGEIDEYGVIYFSESDETGSKIALTKKSYLLNKTYRDILLFSLIYIAAMAVFFAVSTLLSRIAVKPMEEAVEMERRFVADISHDLKTPITVVLANNSILRSDPDAKISQQSQWIDSTEDAAKNMMKLVNEMLTLSSLEQSDKKLERRRTDATAAVTKCALQMESVAYECGVELVTQIDDDVYVMADNDYLERICSGLTENALKYEENGGVVEITLRKNKKKAELCVKNKSSFISDEDMPHIFERFYRSDKARSQKGGHGLGLPIINQMVALCGAQINVKSSEADGTEFCVCFELSEKDRI